MPEINVLVFGNLPIHAGGRQSSGASVVMWQLADKVNELCFDVCIKFIATDLFEYTKLTGNTCVYGWTKQKVFSLLLKKPFRASLYLTDALRLATRYQMPFLAVYVKLIWFDSIIRDNSKALYHVHGCDYTVILECVLTRNGINSSRMMHTVHAIAGNDEKIPTKEQERLKEKDLAVYKPYIIVFVSKALQKEWIESYGQINSLVIPNTVNDVYLEYKQKENVVERNYADNIKTIITIGSISERKGQFRVLKAIAASVNRQSIRYICIGHGDKDEIDQMRDFAFKNGISFEYAGVLNSEGIISLLSSSHFMILPSSSEGFGLVYIESLSTGTPVILPKQLPIVAEVDMDAVNSIFLENHDIDSIVSVLDTIHNYNFDNQLVANSIDLMSWTDVAAKYAALYKKMYEEVW